MYTLLDTCLDRLDIFEFLNHVEDGLKDHYDIKVSGSDTLNGSCCNSCNTLQNVEIKSTCTLCNLLSRVVTDICREGSLYCVKFLRIYRTSA